jgi:Ca2+-binding RTX toxin-like protein
MSTVKKYLESTNLSIVAYGDLTTLIASDAGKYVDSLTNEDGEIKMSLTEAKAFAGVTEELKEDGDDYLDGGNGDDTLTSEAGADTLSGGNGDDTLTGGAGADTLDGSNGSDIIAINNFEKRILINNIIRDVA